MSRVRLDAAARAEFLHEVLYYETVQRGLGRKFRESIDTAVERLLRVPDSGRPEDLDCRRIRVEGFPFSLVYRVEARETVIYAVRNDARQPGYWLERAK
ncbi:type II toxin-antitoxin system RelE/ParE family toxin [Ramlibacter albus]|uniref:Type II toxin-antitoxin system RelE/ParE family toxin n=1 Tax=Ramlibacter albus TaxID=2079448 RepID=A0A923S1R3_9BURK|nr:type II toxin-antitoxin system RelE/ParE family toxin [Ramlibacter albus]